MRARQSTEDVDIRKPTGKEECYSIPWMGQVPSSTSKEEITGQFEMALPRNGNLKRTGRDDLERQQHDGCREMAVGYVFTWIIQRMAQGREDVADPVCYPTGRFGMTQVSRTMAGRIGQQEIQEVGILDDHYTVSSGEGNDAIELTGRHDR